MMSHMFILFLLCCDWYHPPPPSGGTIGALAFRPTVAVREKKHTSCNNGGASLMHRQQQQQQQNQQQQQSNTNVAGVLGRKVAPLCSSIRNEQQVNDKNDDDEPPLSIECIDCDTLTSSVELPSGGMVSNKDETLTKTSNVASTITLDNDSVNDDTDTAIIRAKTLDGRLLCATQCAYGFDTAAPDDASDYGIYFRGASYVAGTTAKRISRGVNSAFVGRTVDGIVIAFRGTQPSSPLDWLQNAAIFLSKIKSSKSNKMIDIPGFIHSGYYQAVKSLWNPVTNEVKALLKNDPHGNNNNVYITGHSKGGAMASIAAILFQLDESLPVNVTQVCTFGSIKVGNSPFRDAYNQLVNQTSYENHLDIIPFLPPSSNSFMEEMVDDADMINMLDGMLWSREYKQKKNKYTWDYQTVGSRRYIDKTGKVVKIDNNNNNNNQPSSSSSYTKDLDRMRIQEIEKKTFLSVKEFSAGHCSTCPDSKNNCDGGYFRAISDEVCQQKHDVVQAS